MDFLLRNSKATIDAWRAISSIVLSAVQTASQRDIAWYHVNRVNQWKGSPPGGHFSRASASAGVTRGMISKLTGTMFNHCVIS